MKNARLFVALCLLAVLTFGFSACVSSAPKTDTAKTDSAPVEVAARPDVFIVTDFEAQPKLDTYKGGGSSISAEVSSEQFHGGAYSAKIVADTKDYVGAVLHFSGEEGDWSGYSSLHFWAYGSNSGAKFNIVVAEKKKEQFQVSNLADDFTGWKEFIIPISDFKSRTDWQADDATVDRSLQADSLTEIHIFASNGKATTMYFDDYSLTK